MRYCVPMDGTASDGLALQQRKRLLMDPTFWRRTMIILILDHNLRFCKRTRWCVKNKGEKKQRESKETTCYEWLNAPPVPLVPPYLASEVSTLCFTTFSLLCYTTFLLHYIYLMSNILRIERKAMIDIG